jgi:hypothetical protein
VPAGSAGAKRRQLADGTYTVQTDESDACQLAWAKRGQGSSNTWRSRPVYRVGAKKYLAHYDNQLRMSTPLPGLVFYKKDVALDIWKNWRTHPHLLLPQDLGSDGVTAVSAAIYHYKLAVTRLPDFDHGLQRSLWEVMKGAGIYEFFLLMCVSWSLNCGWDNNDYRYKQFKESSEQCIAKYTAKTCILFQDHVGDIDAELAAAGVELAGELDRDDEIFNLWATRARTQNKSDRIMLNRFASCIDRAEKELPFWTIDLFQREYCGLALDMFKSKRFREKMLLRRADPAGEGGGPTSSKATQIEDAGLRSCCDNAVCISVAMLSERNNKRIVENLFGSLAHYKVWRVAMVKETRLGADAGREYVLKQINGGFMSHIMKGVRNLESTAYLQKVQFVLPLPDEIVEQATIAIDDDFATMQWKLTMGAASAHLSRNLFLWSPPVGFTSIIGEEKVVAKTFLFWFQKDVQIFRELADAMPHLPAKLKRMYDRHLCQHQSVQTYMEACDEVGYGPDAHPELIARATNCMTGAVTTTINEEIVGITKNFKELN